ncbi:MAG: hypothetical protein BWY72_01764 [Bacteroidetes bacterium ADurb.Bin416]|nr:MAG: hypothetical protein BWY72_01764 [Bacteroidetes bacterium ADurb.Bin416]
MRAPGHGGLDVGGVDGHHAVELGARVAGQRAPARHRGVEVGALRRQRAAAQVVEGDLVRRHHAAARAGFDRHVAQGHALLHIQGFDGAAVEFEGMPGAAVEADFTDDVKCQILGAHGRV